MKELGGSGRPAEVKEIIVRKLRISEEEQCRPMASGSSRFSNQVDWARFYLTKAGYLDSSERGVWSLTRKTVYVVNEEFFREFMSADK